MKIRCYHCGNFFERHDGFYVERRVSNPGVIPAEQELTGGGYCSQACAESHHILERDSKLQDLGNYEETETSVVMSSLDGGFRGEVLKIHELRNKLERCQKSQTKPADGQPCWECSPLCFMMAS